MSQMLATWLGAVLSALLITPLARTLSRSLDMFDRPNERSLHSRPTPRGGGIAIAIVLLVGSALLGALGVFSPRFAIALGSGGLAVAGIGWLDDRFNVPIAIRGSVHVLAGVWGVAWLGGMPQAGLGTLSLSLGGLGGVVAVLGVAWLVNVYNFMDGIDGLAAGTAAVAGGAAALISATQGRTELAAAAALASGSALGFLAWNWSPAKIFMGDVGSGLLGFWFGVVAIRGENTGGLGVAPWTVLLGVFVVDATLTVIRRVVAREPWLHPHRSHAYQRMVLAGASHRYVTTLLLGVTAALGIVAALIQYRPDRALVLGAGALLVLGIGYAAVGRVGSGTQRRPTKPGSIRDGTTPRA